jgi:type IX secretion system PorP/SprF family membrane protein
MRNPALTGIFTGDYKAGVNYRTQWGRMASPFRTVLASVETRIRVSRELDDYLSIGLSSSYDQAGAISFKSYQVYPAINYNKSLRDDHMSYLSVGFAGGYIQRSLDPGRMTLDNQYVNGSYNAANPTGDRTAFTKITHYDLSAGVSLNSSLGTDNRINYYIGAAAYHLTRPKEAFQAAESFIRLSTRYTGSFGLQWQLSDRAALTVHANYQHQQPYQETIAGALLSWRNNSQLFSDNHFALYSGVFYRVNDAIIPTVKVDYRTWSFVMSHDITTSALRTVNEGRGGWECSVYVRGKIFRNLLDRTSCPRFEDLNDGLEVY